MTDEQETRAELAEAKAADTAEVTDGMRAGGVEAGELFNREGHVGPAGRGQLSDRRYREEIERGLAFGLEAADSITDRRIPTFARGEIPHFAGERGTFMKCPYLEDVHDVGDAEVAIFGAPLDAGTTYRPGHPVRSAGHPPGDEPVRHVQLRDGRRPPRAAEHGRHRRRLHDPGQPGEVVRPDQQGDEPRRSNGVFPVVLGGDHSIGYPTIRGLAPHMDGNIGIIHFDRHVDTQELDLDERMHTTPWFHATNIKNAPATNLVQIGIGGWQAPRAGVKVGGGAGPRS